MEVDKKLKLRHNLHQNHVHLVVIITIPFLQMSNRQDMKRIGTHLQGWTN